jgi:hypothetical protein
MNDENMTIAFHSSFIIHNSTLSLLSCGNMKTTDLLHFAFRAKDPLAMGLWYADLFEGQFFTHPVMSGLGIVCVKLNHPEALFRGLLEFWPWDIVWDGQAAVFRRIDPAPSPTSYGHVAIKVQLGADAVLAELMRRGIPYRLEPRARRRFASSGRPRRQYGRVVSKHRTHRTAASALCSREQIAHVMATMKSRLEQHLTARHAQNGVPLLLFEAN